jgi:hypothetical protein
MLKEFKEIVTRSHATVVEDTLGVVALFVLLFAGLSFPGA